MTNEINRLELVRSRRSVRSFNGNALPESKLDTIIDFAATVESPYDIPFTWRILDAVEMGLSCPVITGTDTYIAGKMPRTDHAEEAFGYAFERIVLFLQSMGIGTTWIGGTMDRPAFERAMHLEENEVMPCVSPIGYPASKMSLRESVMRKGVRADTRLSFEDLFFNRSFDQPLSADTAGILFEALEMVRWAPSAVNKQPWRVIVAGDNVHFYEKQNKGFVAANGWDMQKIDIGIALCHFAFGMEEKTTALELCIKDPGFAAPADTQYIASYRVL